MEYGIFCFISLPFKHLRDTAFSSTSRQDFPPAKRLQLTEGSGDG